MLFYIINAFLGASVAILIALVSQSKIPVLAGMVPLIPIFAVFAHVLAFQKGGEEMVKGVAQFGLVSLIPYALYLAVMMCMTHTNGNFSSSMSIALMVWCVSAIGAYVVWQYIA